MYQDQRARSLGEEEEPLIPLPFQVGEVTEKEPLIPQPVQVGEITEEELKQYNGSDPQKLLLLAIKHQIYAVTESRMFYGPGAPYALFAGIDISRALAKMSFEEKDLTWDISGLGPFELEALQDWEYKFMSKYAKWRIKLVPPLVGTVKVTGLDASNRDPLVARPETTVVEKNDEAPAESDVKKG